MKFTEVLCHRASIAGIIILIPSHPCEVTATDLKVDTHTEWQSTSLQWWLGQHGLFQVIKQVEQQLSTTKARGMFH